MNPTIFIRRHPLTLDYSKVLWESLSLPGPCGEDMPIMVKGIRLKVIIRLRKSMKTILETRNFASLPQISLPPIAGGHIIEDERRFDRPFTPAITIRTP